MFTVIVMNFAKKDNSTKQPTGGGLALQGVLKEPSSIMNPTIRIEPLAGNASPHGYNYAYINKFGRFYFIEDWVWSDGLWEVKMTVDVLASFKTEIGQQSEYILRTDSTTDFNEYITDTMYPTTTDFTINEYLMQNAFTTNISIGCYVVGCISYASTASVGSITYYAMYSSQFNTLKDILFSDQNFETMGILDTSTTPPTWKLDDMSKELLKTMYNPFQYIVSCMWFPFGTSALTSSGSQNIKLGYWEYNVSATVIYPQRLELAESGSLPSHPQASTRGKYLNYAPYTRRTIIGRFGTVALDCSYCKDTDTLGVDYLIDVITGQCSSAIVLNSGQNRTVLARRDFLLGVPIQLAQVGTDYLGSVVAGIEAGKKTMAGALLGGAVAGIGGAIIGGLASGGGAIYNAIDSVMPQVETSGSNGSFLSPQLQTTVLSQFFNLVDENIVHKGRPLCEIKTINSLSGYVLCAESDIDIACYDNERKKIGQYLVTGFYWE